MTKPSDFSPAEAIEVEGGNHARQWRRTWILRVVGVVVLLFGWLAVAVQDFGQAMFFVDTGVFLAMALYAFTAAAMSRIQAVNQEKKLRLSLLVHNIELENMASRDGLTQLFNRRYLFERLERELHAARGFQRPIGFVAIEVKSLDPINQTHGYAVGDRLLADFGQLLMDCTRATDIPARMSGNKFGIILLDTPKAGAYAMIERLNQALTTTPLLEDAGSSSPVTVSFGVSGYPWGGETTDAIVRQAEAEMQPAAPGGEENAHGEEPSVDIPAIFRRPGKSAGGPEATKS